MTQDLTAAETGGKMTLRETVARKMWPDEFSDDPRVAHKACSPMKVETVREKRLRMADAALEAIRAAGWAVVPVEPTEAMIAAAVKVAEYEAEYESRPFGQPAECQETLICNWPRIARACLSAALAAAGVK
jgi:hypothetical protein